MGSPNARLKSQSERVMLPPVLQGFFDTADDQNESQRTVKEAKGYLANHIQGERPRMVFWPIRLKVIPVPANSNTL
jgi:hypothetical protein